MNVVMKHANAESALLPTSVGVLSVKLASVVPFGMHVYRLVESAAT